MMMKNRLKNIPTAFYILIILMLLCGCLTENFFSADNLSNILSQAAPLFVLACGQTLIVLMQGTDLSAGSIVSITGVLWIYLLNIGAPMLVSIFLIVAAGAILGLVNGAIVAKGFLPVFIVTLATQNIFKSIALLLCGSQTLYYEHPIFRTIAKNGAAGLSWSVWIALICFLLTWVLLSKTRFGRKVKGIGGNPEVLVLSGASISVSQIKAFVYAGIMAAVGGMLLCCRIESGNPNAGNGMEFNAIAAVLLGGTSLREGKGGVGGTVFGVLLIQVLKTGLTQIGISSIYQNALIGTVVLGAIIVDALIKGSQA